MNNKVIDYNYLEDRYKNLFYYSTIENGINDNNRKTINNFIDFINDLLLMSSMKISSRQESDINPLVTGQIDHTIEPRNIGLSLVNESLRVYKVRICVFTVKFLLTRPTKDLLMSLQLIIKENAECVKHAALYIQEGAAVANKNRNSVFTSVANSNDYDKSNIDVFISTHKLLNVLVTNCAIDNIKTRLLFNNMPVICKWFDDFVQDIATVDSVNSMISPKQPLRSTHLILDHQLILTKSPRGR